MDPRRALGVVHRDQGLDFALCELQRLLLSENTK